MKNGMENFNNEWKPKRVKEWDKDMRREQLEALLPDLIDDYLKHGHQARNRETVAEVFERMSQKTFAKTLSKIIDAGEVRIDIALVMMINDMISSNYEEMESEVVDLYAEIGERLLKKRTKKVAKKSGVNKDLVKEVLAVMTHPEVVTDDRFIGVHVRNVLRKIYMLAQENEIGLDTVELVRGLMEELFGEDRINLVAIAVLLERKDTIRHFNPSQMKVWNLMTDFALVTLNNNKKKVIAQLLVDRYIGLRHNEANKSRDAARRIQFSSISEEIYPKIHEVVVGLCTKNENSDLYSKYL